MQTDFEASGDLNIRCLIECPHCENIFDLFEMQSLTDDGYIYDELMDASEGFGREDWGEIVQCPTCKVTVIIKHVRW